MKQILEKKIIDLYDVDINIASSIQKYKAEQVTLYTDHDINNKTSNIAKRPYGATLEAADCMADICFLDNRAIKVLFAMYPSAPNYVLVRLALKTSWFLGLIGLLRRLIAGFLRVDSIISIQDLNGKKTRWLVLSQKGILGQRVPVLPSKIGVSKFLEWLRNEKINYVVLRFYEKLPSLYRVGGDIDILLSNEDKERVKLYLDKNKNLLTSASKDIRLGLHTVSGEKGSIPYYPPILAGQILVNSKDGPAGSRIPNAEDSLKALIYHVLYHAKKGYAAGIPSSLKKITEKNPENDYFGIIQSMSKSLGVSLGNTMEELDEYLAAEGWRPKLDTLAKMGETNAWVYDRFFSLGQGGPVGLAVFMLREWIHEKGLTHQALEIIKENGFLVMKEKVLSKEEKKKASETLRGGSWGQNPDGTNKGWLPAVALVVVDLKCVKMPPTYAKGYEHYKIRKLKKILRASFDKGEIGAVHSTDNAHESWEYIDICFPDDTEIIRKEFNSLAQVSVFSKLSQLLSPTYIRHSLIFSLREHMIRRYLS